MRGSHLPGRLIAIEQKTMQNKRNTAGRTAGALVRFAALLAATVAFDVSAVEIKEKNAGGKTVRWFEEMVPMKDGTRLYTYGTAPEKGRRCAVVITRNPYVKSVPVADMGAFAVSKRADLKRGYARVYQHCRGCGMSEGDWVPYESEREDGLALLEWVRKLPFYNGEIFLDGGSYLASVHWSYLATDPHDVKGAYLGVQDLNRYNIVYRNGFLKTALHGNWFIRGYKKKNRALKRDPAVTLACFPLAAFSRRHWGEDVPAFDNVIMNPRPDAPFWKSGLPGSGAGYRRALADSTVPVALIGGFYDIYTDGVFEMWREMSRGRRANCVLVVDPHSHSGVADKTLVGTIAEFPDAVRSKNGMNALDWFDYCRTGKKTAAVKPGMTRYYALWENRWITEEEMKDGPREITVPLAPPSAPPRTWTYDPLRPLPVFPGSGGICFGGMQAQPPPGFRDDVVSFTLGEIAERIDVRGRIALALTVSSDCEDTGIYVRLSVKKKDDGRWLLLRDDITSMAWTAPYVPGEKRTVRFKFADHAFRLDKGDVLRVDVAGGSAHFVPHANVAGLQALVEKPKKARNTVYPGSSVLTLYAAASAPEN